MTLLMDLADGHTYLALDHPDAGRSVEVIPLTFGRARITITDGFTVYDSW